MRRAVTSLALCPRRIGSAPAGKRAGLPWIPAPDGLPGGETYRFFAGARSRAYACGMTPGGVPRSDERRDAMGQPEVDVVIEVPRGSFLKRGSKGHIDFVSPLPCPYNYGSVPRYLGLEGDLLDAVVLGPRLPLGTRLRTFAWGAVILIDRGMADDKLICSSHPVTANERQQVLRFFRLYARCKGLLNLWRRRPGRNACGGWCEAEEALARSTPRESTWRGPRVEF